MSAKKRAPHIHWDLLFAITGSIAAAAIVVAVPEWRSPVRVAIGGAAVLFFPGYALASLLFPSRGDIGTIERLVLVPGLSVAVVPLILLALNLTPLGLGPAPVATSVASFSVLAAIVAALRRPRHPRATTLRPHVGKIHWRTSVALLATAVVAAGALVSAARVLQPSDTFTAFFLLGHDGTLAELPETVVAGESFVVTLGVENHEDKTVRYEVRSISIDQVLTLATPLIADGETWSSRVRLTAPHEPGPAIVRLALLRDGRIYRQLHLALDVRKAAGGSPPP